MKDLLPTLQEGDTLMVWKLNRHRQALQRDIEFLRRKHTQNRRILTREVAQTLRMADQAERVQSIERTYCGPSL